MEKATNYKSGCMPNTDFRYEEFEGFLASYYLTYQHLETSADKKQVEGFRKLYEILERFAKRHNVQIPQEAIKNVRAKEEWGKPKRITSYWSVKDLLNAIWHDFGLANEAGDDWNDGKALNDLVKSPLFAF